jgi:hypothetical protein
LRPRVELLQELGPTGFVEAADLLVAAGRDPASVKTERFGPTGIWP